MDTKALVVLGNNWSAAGAAVQVAVVEVKIASSNISLKQIDFATVQFPQVSRFWRFFLDVQVSLNWQPEELVVYYVVL